MTLFLPVAWIFLFLVIPLVFVFIYGFGYYSESYTLQLWPMDPGNYLYAISLGRGAIVIPLLARTFGVALATTLVALFFGYIMAYYIARIAKERWRGVLMGLVVVPFWVSFIVRIYAVFPFTNSESFIHDGLRGAGLGFLSSAILSIFEIGTAQMLVFTLMYVWLPFMVLPAFIGISLGLVGIIKMKFALIIAAFFGILGLIGPSFWLDRRKRARQLSFRRGL